ncbi:hypothetical protein BpHYR1_011424 [Brachionus plicatilis]|uniref:Myb-like domain-containing protein n=1 Tax=Brachionus plicatilis TaxID=10195 RepID=A0A3M7RFF2_BRAPC|nr:hypothetical protein BpHYR1_011424 [Brachionus plicatilis]
MEVVSSEPTNSGKEPGAQVNGELQLQKPDPFIESTKDPDSWTYRDQLMLISFAIVNGDSNWSHVTDQMNKLGMKKKTSAQCSKQYRQIIKDFLNKSEQSEHKNQLIDLKKIYSEIAEQHLDEVNSTIKCLKDQYGHTAAKINDLIDLECNETTELPLSDKFKESIVQWVSLNLHHTDQHTFNERYNQSLIATLKQIQSNKEMNQELVDLLEKDANFKRQEDERLRLDELERLAQIERLRLEEERKRVEEQRMEEEQRIKREQEELSKIEVKVEQTQFDEDSKDSSRFSSEDDMPLLKIVKSKGLLADNKTKSPSPLPSEQVRRSLRKAKGDEVSSPNHMSSASSTVSTISHKSVSLPCSSVSEDKENKNESVKASPSNTSSVYDNLDGDENQDVFKSKKKSVRKADEEAVEEASSGNLVSIKQEPKEGCSLDLEANKAANISGSSLSSVSTGGNYVLSKPLRYKEMRSSSTASDGKSSVLSSLNATQDVQHDEAVAGLLVKKGRPIKNSKSNSKSSLKDESGNDAGSIKSNSSVSTPRQSSTRSRVSSVAKTSQQKSPKQTLAKKEETNAKKRKPSVSNSATNLNASVEPVKEKDKEDDAPKTKRRKSGR